MKYTPSQKGRIPSALVAYLVSAVPSSMFTQRAPMPYQSILETLVSLAPELQVPERLLQPPQNFFINRMKKEHDYLQLLMGVRCRTPNGRVRKLRILMDTGAQANLIREGLVPYTCTTVADKPVSLMAANGMPPVSYTHLTLPTKA